MISLCIKLQLEPESKENDREGQTLWLRVG